MALKGIIARLRGLLARQTQPQAPGYIPNLWVRPEAGTTVTDWTALQYSVVFSCVRLIAEMIGSLPWNVLRERANGGSDRITTHPAYRLLQRRANPEMAAGIFRETLVSHALIWGNGYAEIVFDGSQRPTSMWIVHPSSVSVKRTESGELVYEVTQSSGARSVIPAAGMFHLKGIGYDGLVGYSMVELAARTIGIGLAEDQFVGAFFGNGCWNGGALEYPGKLGDEEYKRLKESVEQRHRGASKAHKLMILEGGMTLKPPGTATNEQSQLAEARRHQQLEVCRFFRVPPHKIFDLERGTFSNIVEQNIEFVQDQAPWLRRLEQEADIKLTSDKAGDIFTKLNATALLRGDPQRRADFYTKMHNMGCYSANRILELEDENPIGPEGDEHFIASGMRTLADAIKAGEEKPPQPVPPGLPVPDDQPSEDDEESPPVDENAELAVREFIDDTIRQMLRKEAYAVRNASVDKFAANHRMQFADRLAVPIGAWLRLHGQNGESTMTATSLANSLADLHMGRFEKLVDELEAIPLAGREAAVLDREAERIEQLGELVVMRLRNAIGEGSDDEHDN